MSRFLRLPTRDPRTLARDIPGIPKILFPQLTSSFVASLNKRSIEISNINAVDDLLVKQSHLARSMLFEFAYAIAEQKINFMAEISIQECFEIAKYRQAKYYDFSPLSYDAITDIDIEIADIVAENLVSMLSCYKQQLNTAVVIEPPIYGFEWISNSQGDFALDSTLIEVKCINKNFAVADYRQALIYWLLSYIKSLNSDVQEWTNIILMNPRLNKTVEVSVDHLLYEISGGQSKIEIVQMFSSIISEFYRHN